MLKLHYAPNTRSDRIVWLLEELGLPYELNRMKFQPEDLKSDEHRARHPLGRVPVLEDNNVLLYESGAIVDYIIERHGGGRLKPAVESLAYPQFLQWFHYCEGMVMPSINTIMVHTLILSPERRNEETLAEARKLLGKTLAPVDQILSNRQYLAYEFSAADIMLGHAVYVSGRIGEIGDGLPSLAPYIRRLEDRPAFQKAMAA